MTMKRKIIALAAILALAFAAGQNLFAQTDDQTDPQDLEDQITAVDQTGQEDLTALLTRLSIQYNVELTVLQDLSAQGYEPGQIWIALEITAASLRLSRCSCPCRRDRRTRLGVLAQNWA